jgi:DNA-binding NtrC family response regulator
VTAGQRVRVLVVDDDARVRSALRHLLDGATDLQCLAVDSGQAMRLVLWGSPVPDVAVVDMPSASGTSSALVERLAALMPVVVVSMAGSTRVAALAAGALRFVEKDGDAGALVAAIRSAADARPESLARMTGPRQNDALGGQRHGAAPAPGPSGEEAR